LTAALAVLAGVARLAAQPFHLPTANRAIFDSSGERFLVGTVGKPWSSGAFGCVRSEGWQFHEGLDIRCLERDRRGEPLDPVLATADGTVAYANSRPSLSNYGNYLILRHQIDGLEIYSLYAHLKDIRAGLRPGQSVKAGEVIATMGRTTNTREGISRERAHVHFELNLLLNERFAEWYRRSHPGQRNDHGAWNGQNLVGLDPQAVFLAQQRQGAKLNLVEFVRGQAELCRVLVRDTNFPWLRRYPQFVRPAEPGAAPTAGYEIALNFAGVPYELIPRPAGAFKSKARLQLLSVNAAEYAKNPCRRLVTRKGARWELARNGTLLLELLTHD
jgi:murein DD-endopeptidase MepM/ murein hydrolase activator NlpD